MYKIAVGAWGIQPTEFWKMHPIEFWWLVDVKAQGDQNELEREKWEEYYSKLT